jgi:hypothetical protein
VAQKVLTNARSCMADFPWRPGELSCKCSTHDDIAQHLHLLHYPLTSVARALRHSLQD